MPHCFSWVINRWVLISTRYCQAIPSHWMQTSLTLPEPYNDLVISPSWLASTIRFLTFALTLQKLVNQLLKHVTLNFTTTPNFQNSFSSLINYVVSKFLVVFSVQQQLYGKFCCILVLHALERIPAFSSKALFNRSSNWINLKNRFTSLHFASWACRMSI